MKEYIDPNAPGGDDPAGISPLVMTSIILAAAAAVMILRKKKES